MEKQFFLAVASGKKRMAERVGDRFGVGRVDLLPLLMNPSSVSHLIPPVVVSSLAPQLIKKPENERSHQL